MENLLRYWNRYAGRTAWVFGKGPSLDAWHAAGGAKQEAKGGVLWVGINEVAGWLPWCDFGFANDWRVVEAVLEGRVDSSMVGTWMLPGNWKPAKDAVYPDRPEGIHWYCPTTIRVGSWEDRRVAAERNWLVHYEGTLLTALQFLHIAGVEKIVAVGIDGGGGYPHPERWCSPAGDNGAAASIRRAFEETAKRWGVAVDFWSETHRAGGKRQGAG